MYKITSALKAKLSITNEAGTQAKLEKALFFSGSGIKSKQGIADFEPANKQGS